jgi:hypothetical protein
VPDTDEMAEVTEEEIKTTSDPTLLADPAKGNEGILDDEDPEFVTHEAEAAEEIILAEDVVDEVGEEVPSQ